MPSNTSAATATLISSLPYGITVAPDDAAQDLWWKYVAQAQDVAVGLFAWADDAGAYRPTIHVWRGDNPGTIDDDTPLNGFEAARKPCVLPVTPGDTYYFQVEDANGTEPLGAPLVFSALPNPAAKARRGDYFIPDDTGGADDNEGWFPASITSPSTEACTRLVRFAAGERADVLPTGEILSENWNSTDGQHLSLYGKDLTKILDVPGLQGGSIRAHGTLGVFYVYDPLSGNVLTVSRTGVVGGTTWAITSPRAIAANVAGTVLYYTSGPSAGAALMRWDLVNDVGVTDVTSSGVATYSIGEDVLVMADDTVVVFYAKSGDAFARRYSADGSTILHTYSFGASGFDRANIAPDRQSFVVWDHIADANSRFTQYAIDGTVLDTFTSYQCNAGFFQFATPIVNPQRFGHSQSCPLIVLQQDEDVVLAVDESLPCCDACECPPAPGPTGSPSSSPIPTSTGPVLPPVNVIPPAGPPTPLDPSYWERLCAGAGTVPTASDPVDAESWVRV